MDEILITATVFGAILLFTKLILDHAKEKHRIRASASSGSSMTSGELKKLVREALEELIDDRFGRLERKLEEIEQPKMISAATEPAEVEPPATPPVTRDRDLTR